MGRNLKGMTSIKNWLGFIHLINLIVAFFHMFIEGGKNCDKNI